VPRVVKTITVANAARCRSRLVRRSTSPFRDYQTKKTESEVKSVSGKIAASAVLVTLAASAAMLPSSAEAGDYCYNATNGGTDCSFTSMEQCQATAMGPSGTCTHAINWGAAPASGGSYAYYGGARDPKRVAPPQ
jgi:hypothetical protein